MNIFRSKSKQKAEQQEAEIEKLKKENSGLQSKVKDLNSLIAQMTT